MNQDNINETGNPAKKKSILLVEDEAIIAMMQKQELEKCGYNVSISSNGKTAIDICNRENHPDLVLMDIDLGRGMDGTEAAVEILKTRDIPIVFLSSHTEEDVVNRTENISSYGYVVKNSGITVLDASIKMAFKLYEAYISISTQRMEIEAAYEEMQQSNEELETLNEELYSSQYQFSQLFENMIAAVIAYELIYDKESRPCDLRYISINPAFEKMTGMSAYSLIGKTAREVFPATEQHWIDIFGEVVKTGKPRSYVNYSNALGRHFDAWIFPLDNRQVASVFTDITSQKKGEEKLAEARKVLESTQQLAKIGFWNLDTGTMKLEWSNGLKLIYDMDMETPEPEYSEFLEMIHPEDREIAQKTIEAHISTNQEPVVKNEYRIITKKGSLKYLEVLAQQVYDSDGTISGIYGSTQDQTERKLVEEKLQESEIHFRTLADYGQALIWTSDINGKYDYVNQPWLNFTGYTTEDTMGDGWQKVIHPDDLNYCYSIFMEASLKKEPFSIEARMLHHDGSYRWVHNNGTPLYNHRKEFVGYIGHCLDINENRKASEKIINLLKEKELILKEVHHRIKNNMNTISSLLTIQADDQDDRKTRNILLDAVGRVQSMKILYDKFYHSDDSSSLSVKDYLSSLMTEVVNIFPNNESVRIITDIEDIVMHTRTLSPLGIIINELVTNSMKYSRSIDRESILSLSVKKTGDQVKLIYEDNGPGIPESVTFENSSGFGLQLVGMLTRQIEGRISIERNRGTRIVLEFIPQKY